MATASTCQNTAKCITRTHCIHTSSLGPIDRAALVDQTYAVYRSTVAGWTREEFEAEVIGADEIHLALFYDASDKLAGFSSAKVDRLSHEGRSHAVYCAFVYFLPGYHGGASASLFGLRHALRLKLREPRTRVAYFTRSSSPAVYHLLATTMPRLYPKRYTPTPIEVEALVDELSARRGYVQVGEHPWVVRSAAIPRGASRLRRIGQHPEVRFYTEINPRFAEGQALLTWIPLDAVNIVRGLLRAVRRRCAR
ncbi:hypothetical protein [Mycobacterium shottsii]|uniref:hypothetical protein n=1 Tax=Mycobacterium shottsii TaxID=133549 RepID=UPI0018EA01CB|nr:hypothetical protein [Mycobacterium shottsii]